MGHIRGLLTPAEALYQVFVSSRPTIRSHAFLRTRRHEVSRTARRTAFINRTHIGGINDPRSKSKLDLFSDFIKNNEIQAPKVFVVDPATNTLGLPRDRHRIIRSLKDRSWLRHEGLGVFQAQQKDPTKPGLEDEELFLIQVGVGRDEIPVCKIMERKLLILQRMERTKLEKEKARQNKANAPKEIEVSWAVTQHDLESKLRQMETFLSKGRKVDILLANKKRSKRASPDEAENLLNSIRTRIKEIGARETKAMDGSLSGQATLTVEKIT